MTAPYSASLRQAIHDGASAKSWAIVCASLDRTEDPHKLEELIAFADKYVNVWPETLRVAPIGWWVDLIEGRPQPRWRLARALVIKRREAPPDLNIVRALSDHAATRQLAHLSLAGLELGDDAIADLVTSPRIVQLKTLDLSANLLTPLAARALATSDRLPHLEELDVSSNAFDDRAIEALIASPRLASITTLRACACELGVDAARAIAGSRGLEHLAELDLSYNPLGDRGVGALAASPFFTKLHRLALVRTQLGPLGLIALLASSSLAGVSELDLRENGLQLDAHDPRVAV